MRVRGEVPGGTLALDDVIAGWPMLRQSVLATFDDCRLSGFWKLRYGKDWSTREQARGIIGHRALAEILRTMRGADAETIGPEDALQILYEQAAQRDVEPDERVVLPTRELDFLRMAIAKFAADNRITIRRLLSVEASYQAPVLYPRSEGGTIKRVISTTPDAVIYQDAITLRVIDWKFSFRPPTLRRGEGRDDELTEEGYFQQRAHALVLFRAFPACEVIEHREFYPARTEARTAHLERQRDLPRIVEEFALLAETFDRAMSNGPPRRQRTGGKLVYTLDGLRDWQPSPGYHCRHCLKPSSCPIDPEARRDGAIQTPAQARRYAAEREKADAVKSHHGDALKPWVEQHGPVPVRDGKGARVLGWRETAKSRRFETYIPNGGDGGR